MEATTPRGLTQWASALAGPRAFAVRHYLVVFIPIAIATLVAEGAANPALLGRWAAAIGGSTAIALVAYLAIGRLTALIRRTVWRGAVAPVAYGMVGTIRGTLIVVLAEDFAPIEDVRAVTRIAWNLLAGVVLVAAVAIADRELSDVLALRASVEHRRREAQRLESASSVEEVVARWTEALRLEVGRHFVERRAGSRAGLPETAGRRLCDELEERLTVEASRTEERAAPAPLTRPRADDRHALFRLSADAFDSIRLPLAMVMALCVAVLHDVGAADSVGIAALLAGMIVATAMTVVLVPLVAAACRRLSERTPASLRALAISLGLLVIGAAAALGDAEVDRVVITVEGGVRTEFLVLMTMIAALVAGWAWMIVVGLGPYADVLREQNLRESERVVRLAATHLRALEEAETLLRDRLRDRVEPAIGEIAARVAAEGGEWYSTETRDRIVQVLDRPELPTTPQP